MKISRILPSKEKVNLENLYLNQDLQSIPRKTGMPLVISNYVTDQNDVIARQDENGEFRLPAELKNPFDWRLFQELAAQADALITGAGYLNRYRVEGDKAENLLTQFDPDGSFAWLGEWRLEHDLSRNPDIAIVSRSLNFEIPPAILDQGRKIVVFTTHKQAGSFIADALKGMGVLVEGCGIVGVDGKTLVDYLSDSLNDKVIINTTGPRVLALLLQANVLDRLYITQVQRKIRCADPSELLTVLTENRKMAELSYFGLTKMYLQKNVTMGDGHLGSLRYLVYDNLTSAHLKL